MSRSIDQKVVEMKFDNKQFEDAVKQSRQSIKLMEKDITLLEGAKSLKNLDKAIQSVDFTHMTKSIDRIKDSFSIMGTIGRSVINKLTTDAMSKFQQMTKTVSSSIEKVFSQVYQKGFNRAKNLENADFKIQGLLDRNPDLAGDAAKRLDIEDKISKAIQESVTDTAYGLDEASVAASSLVTILGTTDKGLDKVSRTLNAIAGVAGTTGMAYSQVSDIFTDAAAKGHVSAMETGRLQEQGVAVEQELATYINRNIKLRQKYNKILKNNAKHELKQEDIEELSKKKALDFDLFIDAFQSYYDTAKKANETLDGITANIGAAFGRLGALFIQPLIANSGPIVQFLQVIKDGISSIAKALDNLKIPTIITDFLSTGIYTATSGLNELVQNFKNGVTPLNDFLNKVGKIAEKLDAILLVRNTLFSERTKNPDAPSFDDLYNNIFNSDYNKAMQERNESIGNSYRTISKIKKDFNKTSMSSDQKAAAAQKVYLSQMTDGSLKTIDQWRALYTEYYKSQYNLGEMSKKEAEKIFKSDWFNSMIEKSAMQDYVADMKASEAEIRKVTEHSAALDAEWEEIFSHNYFKDIFDGIKNAISGVLNVLSVFSEAIFGTSGPIKDFYEAINGDPRDARKSLNNITIGFKEATEKFKEFTKNNEGFKLFISNIGKYLSIAAKIFGGIFKIIGHLVIALAPLASRIADTIGKIFKTATDSEDDVSLFDKIVNGLCSAIDFLVGVLEKVWSVAESVINWLQEVGIIDFIASIAGGILGFAKMAIDNWPEAWKVIKESLKGFGGFAKEAIGWIKDKLGPAINFTKPYLSGFSDKISELTGGFIDLKKPIEWIKGLFGDTANETSGMTDALELANKSLEKVTDSAGKIGDGLTSAKNGFASFSSFGGKGKIGLDLTSDITDKAMNEFVDTNNMLTQAQKQSKGSSFNAEDVKKTVGPFDWIFSIGAWFKEQFSKINPGEVAKALSKGLQILAGVVAVIAVHDVARGLKRISESITNFSAGITGFDFKAERRRRMAEVLKNIALILGVFIAGIVVISIAVWALGKIPTKQLWSGIGAIAVIGGLMIALVVAVGVLSMFLQGKTKIGTGGEYLYKNNRFLGRIATSVKGPGTITSGAAKELSRIAAVLGVFIAGIVLISREVKSLGQMNVDQLTLGLSVLGIISSGLALLVVLLVVLVHTLNGAGGSGLSPAVSKGFGIAMAGIAAVLIVFTLSIKIIANLILDITKKSNVINRGNLDVAVTIIGGIALGLIALIAVVLLLVRLLSGASGLSSERGKAIAMVLGMVAVIIFVFAQAIGSIMRNIILLTASSYMGQDKLMAATATFEVIATKMIVLVGITLGLVAAMVLIMGHGDMITGNAMKKVPIILGIVAVIIFVFGQAVGSIIRNIIGLTIAFANADPKKIDAISSLVGQIIGGLIAFIAVIMVFITLFSVMPSINMAGIVSASAIIIVATTLFAGLIVAIGYSASFCKDVNADTLRSFALIAGVVGAVLAVIFVIVGVIASSPSIDTSKINALSVFAIALGGMFAAIGIMVALASQYEISQNTLIALGIALGIIAVMGALAILISKFNVSEKSLLVLVKFVGILSLLFIAIGGMVALAGWGVDLIVNAIEKLINTLSSFGDNKNVDNVRKGAKKLGSVFGDILEGIVDSIIEFGKKIDKKKPQLVAAIKKIGGIIRAGASSVFSELIGFITDRLGDIITAISTFLDEHKDELLNILLALEDILVPALDHLLDLLIQYGPDTLDGLMDKLIEYGPTFVKKLGKWIANTVDELVVSLNENMPTIVNAIHNLLKTVVNAIFMFFGMDPIFTDIETQAAKESKSIREIGDDTISEMGKSFDIESNDPKIGWVGKFVGAIAQGIWTAVTGNAVIQEAANKISEVMWSLSGLEARYNRVMGELGQKLKRSTGIKGELDEIERQIAGQNRMSVKDYRATGGFEEFWHSETGRIKLIGILLKHNVRDYEKAMEQYGHVLGNIDKKTWERWVHMADTADAKKAISMGVSNFDDAINQASQSHSPSRLFANSSGKNIGDGIIHGIEESITNGSKTIGDTTVSAVSLSLTSAQSDINQATDNFSNGLKPMTFGDMLSESFSGVGEKIRKTLDESGLFGDFFTIKPKVDLSNVENSKSSIQGIFDNMGLGVNVDGASDMFSSLKTGNFSSIDVSKLASGFDSANSNTSNDFSSGNQNTNITFNQNNYSPESLSSIDIYRQTESLLGSNSTVNGIMNAIGVKSSDVKFSF